MIGAKLGIDDFLVASGFPRAPRRARSAFKALARTRIGPSADLPRVVDLFEWAAAKATPPRFIVEGFLLEGEVTIGGGHGGSGKSHAALSQALSISHGLDWFGVPTQRRKVGYVSFEDKREVMHWRVSCAAGAIGLKWPNLVKDGYFNFIDASNVAEPLMVEERGVAKPTTVYEWLKACVAELGLQVLVIDGASDAFGGNENSRPQVRAFVRALRRLIPDDGAVLLLVHVDKNTAKNSETSQGYSGSTAWNNSVRVRWYIRQEPGSETSTLEVQKSNHAAIGTQIRLRWSDPRQTFVGDALAKNKKERDAQAIEDDCNAVFGLIQRAIKQEVTVPAATTGARTSFSVIAAMARFPAAMTKKRFWLALERMKQDGRVKVVETKTRDRKYVRTLVVRGKRATRLKLKRRFARNERNKHFSASPTQGALIALN